MKTFRTFLLENADNEDKLSDQLYTAIISNDLSAVRDCLKAGVDVNSRYKFYWSQTPLCRAAMCLNKGAVKMLISAGADVNIADDRKDTPLHNALFHSFGRPECDEIVEMLIKAGADVNAENKDQCVPLWPAISESARAVKMLLDAGANVSTKLLCHSVKNGSIEIIKMLLDAGGDPTLKNDNGKLPIEFAPNLKIKNVLMLAMRKAGFSDEFPEIRGERELRARAALTVKVKNSDPEVRLFRAVIENDCDEIKALIKSKSVNPNTVITAKLQSENDKLGDVDFAAGDNQLGDFLDPSSSDIVGMSMVEYAGVLLQTGCFESLVNFGAKVPKGVKFIIQVADSVNAFDQSDEMGTDDGRVPEEYADDDDNEDGEFEAGELEDVHGDDFGTALGLAFDIINLTIKKGGVSASQTVKALSNSREYAQQYLAKDIAKAHGMKI